MLTQNDIKQKFQELPQDLQDAIFSEDIAASIMAIGKKHHLPIDKVGKLSSDTNYIILGINHPRNYISNLQQHLEVNQDEARSIAKEVNEQIFAPIRESLKKMHAVDEQITKELPQTPPTPLPSDSALVAEATSAKKAALREGEAKERPPPSFPPDFPTKEETESMVAKALADKNDGPSLAPPSSKTSNGRGKAVEEEQKPLDKLSGVKNEVEQARKENRYPSGKDPYREPIS